MQQDIQASAMAHAHHEVDGSALRCSLENLVDQRKKSSIAFKGEALCAQVPLLEHLLKNIGADQQFQYTLLINGAGFGFHALLNPTAALSIGDMHEFYADGAAIEVARLAGVLVFDLQFGLGLWPEQAEWIKVRLQVTPVAKSVEYSLAVGIGSFQQAGRSWWSGSFRISGGHKVTTRITDAGRYERDSGRGNWIAPASRRRYTLSFDSSSPQLALLQFGWISAATTR